MLLLVVSGLLAMPGAVKGPVRSAGSFLAPAGFNVPTPNYKDIVQHNPIAYTSDPAKQNEPILKTSAPAVEELPKGRHDRVILEGKVGCNFTDTCIVLDFNMDPGGGAVSPCDTGGVSVWQWGPDPNSPEIACDEVPVTNVWATTPGANYPVDAGERLIFGPFEITPDCDWMEICHYYDTEMGWDGGNVKISRDGGATWQLIYPEGGYPGIINSNTSYYAWCVDSQPGFTGNSVSYVKDCFDLSAYIGQTVLIAFDFGSDESMTYTGWDIKWLILGHAEELPPIPPCAIVDTCGPYNYGDWIGDMAYNPNTGTIYQVEVGGNNGIFEWDPVNCAIVSYCSNVPWPTSQRGIAYDPYCDVLFVGGWNQDVIYVVTPPPNCQLLNIIRSPVRGISGLAFDDICRTLWVMTNSSPDLLTEIDYRNGNIVSGPFQVNWCSPSSGYSGAGLSFDAEGYLIAVEQGANILTILDQMGNAVGCCSLYTPTSYGWGVGHVDGSATAWVSQVSPSDWMNYEWALPAFTPPTWSCHMTPPTSCFAFIPPPSQCVLDSTCFIYDFNEDTWGWMDIAPMDPCSAAWQWGPDTLVGPYACDSVPITNVWGTYLNTDYPSNAGHSLLSPPITLEDSCVVMELCHWYDIETYFDGGNVKVSNDGGITWYILFPCNGYPEDQISLANCFLYGQPGFSGNSGGWVKDYFDLSAFAGQTIQIRFDFGSDASFNYPGWYIKWVRIGTPGTAVDLDLIKIIWPQPVVPGMTVYDTLYAHNAGTVVIPESTTLDFVRIILRHIPGDGWDTVAVEPFSYHVDSDWPHCETRAIPTPPFDISDDACGYTYKSIVINQWLNDENPTNDTAEATFVVADSEHFYDDGTPYSAWAYYGPGNGFGVTFVTDSGVQIVGAKMYIWGSDWPVPGGNLIGVRVYEDPLVSEQPAPTPVYSRDSIVIQRGQWNYISFDDTTLISPDGVFSIFYVQQDSYPYVPGLATDQADDAPDSMQWSLYSDTTYIDTGLWDNAGDWMIRALTCPAFVGPSYVRGDANADGAINVTDAVFGLGHLFPPQFACQRAADANADDALNVSDVLYLLGHLFPLNIPAPKFCGDVDTFNTSLPCDSFPPCGYPLKAMPSSEGKASMMMGAPEYGDGEVVIPVYVESDVDFAGIQLEMSYEGEYDVRVETEGCVTEEFDYFSSYEDRGEVAFVGVYSLRPAMNGEEVEGLEAGRYRVAEIVVRGSEVPEFKVENAVLASREGYSIEPEVMLGVGEGERKPRAFALFQNVPNPFSGNTVIKYALPRDVEVELVIYNIAGQRVRTLVNGKQAAGYRAVEWNGRDDSGRPVAPGVYFCKMRAGKFEVTKKLTLLR